VRKNKRPKANLVKFELKEEMLKDKEIRTALIEHIRRRKPAVEKIMEEVRVHNGNAIADVVAFYKETHCYEIKGQTDSISRLTRQAEIYNQTFPRITAVITKNHVRWATKNLPEYWGIIVAEAVSENVKLRHIRKAQTNPDFDKKKALMGLWREELLEIARDKIEIKTSKKATRLELASLMGERLKKSETIKSIKAALISRQPK